MVGMAQGHVVGPWLGAFLAYSAPIYMPPPRCDPFDGYYHRSNAGNKEAGEDAAYMPVGTEVASNLEVMSGCVSRSVHTFHYSDTCDRHEVASGQEYVCLQAMKYVIEARMDDDQIPDYIQAVAGPCLLYTSDAADE